MAAAQSAMAVHLMAVERADCLVPEKVFLFSLLSIYRWVPQHITTTMAGAANRVE